MRKSGSEQVTKGWDYYGAVRVYTRDQLGDKNCNLSIIIYFQSFVQRDRWNSVFPILDCLAYQPFGQRMDFADRNSVGHQDCNQRPE
jgi:hypothetical protein